MFGCVCCGYLCVIRSRWCLPRWKSIGDHFCRDSCQTDRYSALSTLEKYDLVEEEDEPFKGGVENQLAMTSPPANRQRRLDDELYRLTKERARNPNIETWPNSALVHDMTVETHPQEAGHGAENDSACDRQSEDSMQHRTSYQDFEEAAASKQLESTGLSSEGSTEFIGKILASEPGLQELDEISSDERSERNIGGEIVRNNLP
eukprot:202606-Hanusia_phi.AAC.1